MDATTSQKKRSPRGWLSLGAVVVATLSSVSLSYFGLIERPSRGADVSTPRPVLAGKSAAPALPAALTVERLDGRVEIAGPGDAAFRPARAGERLAPDTRLRTADRGSVTLRGDDGLRLSLLGGSEARINQVSRDLSRLALDRGMLDAEVPDDASRMVQVDFDGTGAIARTRGATFSAISLGGAGPAAKIAHSTVGVSRGAVVVSARGKEVTIHTGEKVRITADGLSDVMPIPPTLFNKVTWPAGGPTRQSTVPVAGETDADARVRINDREVAVDGRGRYRADVPLVEGENRLRLLVEHVGQRSVVETSPKIIRKQSTHLEVQRPRW